MMPILLNLRPWAFEAAIGLLVSTFLFNLTIYEVCVSARSAAPAGAGNIVRVSTKYGARYVSAYEAFWMDHFFAVWMPLFVLGFLLKATYRGRRIRYDPLKGRVVDEFIYEDGDVSGRRCVAWFVASAVALIGSWWVSTV
jgi:hypothetical protein